MPQVKSRIDISCQWVTWGIVLVSTTVTWGQSVVINELMASNHATYADAQGQYDDWIELYNTTSHSVNVGGMYLTDNLSKPTEWRIPTDQASLTTIPARGYLIVWADGEVGDAGLHADFSLSANGEAVGLSTSTGTLVDSVTFDQQLTDVSRGRYPDGQATWQTMSSPTPGAANQAGVLGVVDKVGFSVTGGFYDAPMTVTLTSLTPGATIRYSLNGQSDVHDGQVYSQPIHVSTTTSIQAIATKSGWRDAEPVSHTYIFLNDVLKQPKRPTGFPTNHWGSHAVDYAMDPRVVNDPAYADELKDDLKAIPSLCIVIPNDDFFGTKGLYSNGGATGMAWEREAGLEWIDPNTGADFSVNAGLRSQGGVGRRAVKHSLRAIFRSEYGLSKLKFPLFKDSTVDTFDQLVLRATWNYSWVGDSSYCSGLGTSQALYLREPFARDTSLQLGLDAPHARHIHLYVNGLYWGLYILSERVDGGFAEEHFGGQKEDYDVLKASNSFSGAAMETKAGDQQTWNKLFQLAKVGHFSSNQTYENLQQYVDVNEMIDYMLMIYYIGSRDAPVLLCNNNAPRNFYTIRRRDPAGSFVFIPWDCEWSLERVDENRVPIVGQDNPHYLMNKLSENAEFRMLLADHIYRQFYNNGPLTPEASMSRFMKRANEISGPVVGESARWGDLLRPGRPYTRDKEWVQAGDRLLNNYFPDRTDIVLGQLQNEGWYPSFDPPVFKINNVKQSGGGVDTGDRLSMIRENSSTTTYYTLDGTDPREVGGAIAPRALKYGSSFVLNASVEVKARARKSNGDWSALHEAVYGVGPVAENLRVTEVMYHPVEPNAEFIELTNIGSKTLNLARVRFTDGIDFTFPWVELKKNQSIVVVADQAAFESVYGQHKNVAGVYQGRLNDGGERLVLRDALGSVIQDFTYDDIWLPSTDGGGYSLVIRDSQADPNGWSAPTFWKTSQSKQGSPGASETVTSIGTVGPVVINEIMYHPRLNPDAEYVELLNVSNHSVTLYRAGNHRTWRLTDGGTGGLQFSFSGSHSITLAAGARLVLAKDADVFHARYGELSDVAVYAWNTGSLSNSGEDLLLYQPVNSHPADDVLVDQVRYSDGMQNQNFTSGHDPWPITADGMGWALGRLDVTSGGNNPANWQAVDPSPGQL